MEEALLGLASKVALSFVMVFFVFANAFQGVREEPQKLWSRRQESDLYLALRRHLFYPLNYGETRTITKSSCDRGHDYS